MLENGHQCYKLHTLERLTEIKGIAGAYCIHWLYDAKRLVQGIRLKRERTDFSHFRTAPPLFR